MPVSIKNILVYSEKLRDHTFINDLSKRNKEEYNHNTAKYQTIKYADDTTNKPLILAVLIHNLKRDVYIFRGTYSIFKNAAVNLNLVRKSTSSYRYANVGIEDFDFSIIEGITKDTTKKSLSILPKKWVDAIFDAKGLSKRTQKAEKELRITTLDDFSLAIFTAKHNSSKLPLTTVQRIIREHDSNHTQFTKEWSNALLNAIKPSAAGYTYILQRTDDTSAKIHDYIVIVGLSYFTTPVDNYKRDYDTEKNIVTVSTDLSVIPSTALVKALIIAKPNTPIYNYILANVDTSLDCLKEYIAKLTKIKQDIIAKDANA